MLLDIGAKTSNLLFFEKGKVFARSINLGANSITQDFANESKLKFDVADKIKIDEGFVSLGGAYEEPENQHQAAISKIARQFMTRLHITHATAMAIDETPIRVAEHCYGCTAGQGSSCGGALGHDTAAAPSCGT